MSCCRSRSLREISSASILFRIILPYRIRSSFENVNVQPAASALIIIAALPIFPFKFPSCTYCTQFYQSDLWSRVFLDLLSVALPHRSRHDDGRLWILWCDLARDERWSVERSDLPLSHRLQRTISVVVGYGDADTSRGTFTSPLRRQPLIGSSGSTGLMNAR